MDKKTTIKIIREMIAQVKLFEKFPKPKRVEDKRWSEGVIFGMKYLIILVSKMLKDSGKEKIYKKLINWDKEEEKLMGLNNKAWKEHKRRSGF